MNDVKEKLIHLHHCRGVSWDIIYRILKNDPQLDILHHHKMKDYFPPSSISNALTDLSSQTIKDRIKIYDENAIKVITLFDPEYPQILKETYKPPWVLYVKGNVQLLSRKRLLAVVGSRECTLFGKRTIEKLFPYLIQQGLVIVSGLALGIDSIAHKTAIKLGGSTIGVIAGGFDHLYPKENQAMAKYMMEKHLIVSEYPPHIKPQKWHFPMRNRIIAGLCQGTLVVEAKKKSGSLITANYAVHEGREVFAVPGHILDPYSTGTNELIQQGAKLVNNADDIINELL